MFHPGFSAFEAQFYGYISNITRRVNITNVDTAINMQKDGGKDPRGRINNDELNHVETCIHIRSKAIQNTVNHGDIEI